MQFCPEVSCYCSDLVIPKQSPLCFRESFAISYQSNSRSLHSDHRLVFQVGCVLCFILFQFGHCHLKLIHCRSIETKSFLVATYFMGSIKLLDCILHATKIQLTVAMRGITFYKEYYRDMKNS